MSIRPFSAEELFEWLTGNEEFLLLDVRNDEEFARFRVEGPAPIDMLNVPYMEFIEREADSVAKVPKGKKIRIVCAKEGSAKYVGEILAAQGHDDVGYLLAGIYAWGNLLAPVRVNPPGEYDLYQFRRPGKASLSYALVFDGEMMVFDPAKNIAAYQSFAEKKGTKISRVFETHRQADYISGGIALGKTVGAEIMAPEPDFCEATFKYRAVQDGEVVTFTRGGPPVKVVHTPGHTPGSTSYLIDDAYLISGDTVFIHSIGRPDLGGMVDEWSRMLFHTLQDKLLKMDDALMVLPGHYTEWQEADSKLVFIAKLGEIKKINADIYRLPDVAAFTAFIKANIRKQPEAYAKIRQINAGLVEVDEQNADYMDLGKNECAASAV